MVYKVIDTQAENSTLHDCMYSEYPYLPYGATVVHFDQAIHIRLIQLFKFCQVGPDNVADFVSIFTDPHSEITCITNDSNSISSVRKILKLNNQHSIEYRISLR